MPIRARSAPNWRFHDDLTCTQDVQRGAAGALQRPSTSRPDSGIHAAFAAADTVIVPGALHHRAPVPPEVRDLPRHAADRAARVASICTGAFALAADG